VGTLYPKDEAAIAARVEGQVEKTLVDFGDRVRTDQDLAFIDTASYEAQLEQAVGNLAKAEANLANARQNFDRMQKLKNDGVASASDFDLAKSQLDQWDAEVKAARGAHGVAQLNVQRSRVQAPFDGGISLRFVGRGDYVHVGTPLFNLVNDAVLKFIFQVRNVTLRSSRKGFRSNSTWTITPAKHLRAAFTSSARRSTPRHAPLASVLW